jgi:hypothetical protein
MSLPLRIVSATSTNKSEFGLVVGGASNLEHETAQRKEGEGTDDHAENSKKQLTHNRKYPRSTTLASQRLQHNAIATTSGIWNSSVDC